MTPTLTEPEISRLAREIAKDILPLADILKTFKIDESKFETITDSAFFQHRLNEELQLWNASDPVSIDNRIKTKTATMIEDCLIEVYRLIHDPREPMNAKVEALKWAARMAGMGEAKQQGDGSGGVKITINVGGQALEFDKEKKLPERVIDGTVVDLTPSNA